MIYSNTHDDPKAYSHIPAEARLRTCTIPTPWRYHGGTGTQRATVSGPGLSPVEWASPAVMVPKPDGSVRFCIDYRKLNLMTVKDAYPIPRMDECIDSLGDARVFSTLDCNAGYWQIPVAEEDKHLTAFKYHSGAWQCVRLPFG